MRQRLSTIQRSTAIMAEGPREEKIFRLQAQIAALEDLLDTKEKAYEEQTLRLESTLAEAERLRRQYELLLTSAWEGILGLDRKGNHRFVNPAAARMLGYTVAELMGQHSHATWHRQRADGSPYAKEDCPIQAIMVAGKAQQGINEVFWRKDGTSIPVEYTCTPIVQGKHAVGTVLTFWDITDRRRAEEAQARSLVDDLTGLYNRRGFFTLAEHQFKLTKRSHNNMVLFFVDLDELKAINDTLGHLEGDQALSDTADLLRKTFRESDIMARLGGDEFVVLITEPTDAKLILRRLHKNLERHNTTEGRPYHIALSIGMAHYNPLFPSTIEELVRQADTSMYENKRGKQGKSV
jgi:diguanylate cyclase (GGDEF)-like protein/PAS domain S-box-containing protein